MSDKLDIVAFRLSLNMIDKRLDMVDLDQRKIAADLRFLKATLDRLSNDINNTQQRLLELRVRGEVS